MKLQEIIFLNYYVCIVILVYLYRCSRPHHLSPFHPLSEPETPSTYEDRLSCNHLLLEKMLFKLMNAQACVSLLGFLRSCKSSLRMRRCSELTGRPKTTVGFAWWLAGIQNVIIFFPAIACTGLSLRRSFRCIPTHPHSIMEWKSIPDVGNNLLMQSFLTYLLWW